MAIATQCLTPAAVFHTQINNKEVAISVNLPFSLNLSEEKAKELEILLHNAVEIVLSRYFHK